MGYGPIKATVGPALEMLYQPWIRGEENIPAEGAAILASNHLAVIDSFFLPLLVDREVAFIGKSDMTLHGWRQLIEWSIDHACLNEAEHAEVKQAWKESWENFLGYVLEYEAKIKAEEDAAKAQRDALEEEAKKSK